MLRTGAWSPNPPPSPRFQIRREGVLNYRHHFHAGNFADVMKHAILLLLIDAMRARGPVRVVETHAGAGLYDLRGEAARRSSEAEGGVGRLMAADDLPASLAQLKAAVARENPDGRLRFYPGSPLLALGAGAAYRGFELRPDDFDSLQTLVSQRVGAGVPVLDSLDSESKSPIQARGRRPGSNDPVLDSLDSKSRVQRSTAEVAQADGYEALPGVLKDGELVLIDPPFERSDDYDRAAEATGAALAKGAAVAIWAPIKDLETLDALVRRLEALSPRSLVLAEVRLRPLTNPMKMNGCAMLLVDAPDVSEAAGAVCAWTARVCGEAGARGEATRL